MARLGELLSSFFKAFVRIPGSIASSWDAQDDRGGFLTATLIGWGIELLYGMTTQGFIGGVRIFCLLWFASGAAFFIGTVGGFLFGVPKARAGNVNSTQDVQSSSPNSSMLSNGILLYRDNTNLEEVSDWLTKIIIGIGLAQFHPITEFLWAIAEQVGRAVDPKGDCGGTVIAMGSMIIGFSTGFLYYYVWARLILRRTFLRMLELQAIRDQPPASREGLGRGPL